MNVAPHALPRAIATLLSFGAEEAEAHQRRRAQHLVDGGRIVAHGAPWLGWVASDRTRTRADVLRAPRPGQHGIEPVGKEPMRLLQPGDNPHVFRLPSIAHGKLA